MNLSFYLQHPFPAPCFSKPQPSQNSKKFHLPNTIAHIHIPCHHYHAPTELPAKRPFFICAPVFTSWYQVLWLLPQAQQQSWLRAHLESAQIWVLTLTWAVIPTLAHQLLMLRKQGGEVLAQPTRFSGPRGFTSFERWIMCPWPLFSRQLWTWQ